MYEMAVVLSSLRLTVWLESRWENDLMESSAESSS